MTWQRTSTQWFRLPAERLWTVLERLDRWPEWNTAVGSAAVVGSLREGATGHYSPAHPLMGPLHRRTAPAFRVTAVDPGRRLAFRQPQPGGGQDVEWTLEERAGGTDFTQKVTLDGPLAQQFGLTAGEPLVRGFAAQCARLYRLAAPAAGAPGAASDDGGEHAPLTAIAGGTGFLGTSLGSELVCDGQRVVLLTRARRPSPFEQLAWDGRTPGAWSERLGAEPRLRIVNLAGVSLDMPGTPENLAKLEASRVEPTRTLVEASRTWERPVERWLQQSAVGIYGDSYSEADESTPVPPVPGLAAVVRAWEAAFDGASAERSVVLRTSVVLAREAAILERLATVARLGGGGPLGTGMQWFSWIHEADWNRAARAALGLPTAPGEGTLDLPDGVVNATSPYPVQNRELMAHLREFVGVPLGIPAPAPLLRVAAGVLRTNPRLALDSVRAVPGVLRAARFDFRYPQLSGAFREIAA
ncbi:DUF1731 domain-containing protein [Sinomonas sp. JGH33]|uniref:DUF1731 domain-containing protein n=1 Tax=Sinomonas terricola TaxID=3110330 RepID=A0ABU5TBV1_9MICC|nr:DUF1731 domain-containing protein [Sinomonas sp. JGH33]MEA5457173.1 DUF1731 domain-containing protein [Sinomonas sp. JGH33]